MRSWKLCEHCGRLFRVFHFWVSWVSLPKKKKRCLVTLVHGRTHTHPKSLCTDYNDQTRPDQTRPDQQATKIDVWVVVVMVVVGQIWWYHWVWMFKSMRESFGVGNFKPRKKSFVTFELNLLRLVSFN